jgi:hypothetical protein
LGTVVDSILQEAAAAYRPQDQPVSVFLHLQERVDGERDGFADVGVGMFHNSSVEVDSDDHVPECFNFDNKGKKNA